MMHKILFSFLLFSIAANGQVPSADIKANISNTKTTKHINIPGTRLYIIPPENFTIGTGFSGLQKGEDAMINIMDLIGGSYYTNAALISKKEFEDKGAKIFDYGEIKVNGFPAKYISMQGDPNAKTYTLIFGDTTFSTMIMAVYPANDEATGKQIVSALNSIYYDNQMKVDPFETAVFSLNDKNSKFKFWQFIANSYMYTVGGANNLGNIDNPFVIAVQMPTDNTATPKDVADLMINKANQWGVINTQIKNVSTEKINGYDAYEAEVYGEMNGKSCLIYQCVVIKGNKAVVIEGVAKNELPENLKEFKNLAHTIQLK